MFSFMNSTLALAFFICVIATLAMVFLQLEPNQVTFGVVTAVVSAYLARYGTPTEPKANTVSITDTTTSQESINKVKETIDLNQLPESKINVPDLTRIDDSKPNLHDNADIQDVG